MIFIAVIWIAAVLCNVKENSAAEFKNFQAKMFNCENLQILNKQNFVREVVIMNLLDEESYDYECIVKKYNENRQVMLLDGSTHLSKPQENRYYHQMIKINISYALFLPRPDATIIVKSHIYHLLRRIPKAIVEIIFFNDVSPEDLNIFQKFANKILFDLEIVHMIGIVLSPKTNYFIYDVNSNSKDQFVDILTSTNNFNYSDIVSNSHKLRSKSHLIITIFQRFPSCLIEGQNDQHVLVGAHGFAGKDSLMIDDIIQALEIKPIYKIAPGVEPFGVVLENGTATGTLKEIADGTADISANPRFITSYGVDDDIVFLGYNHIDKVCVIIPKAEIVPLWVQVVKTYTLKIWGLIFLQTLLITFLMWIYHKIIIKRSTSPIELLIDTACAYIVPIKSLRNSQQKLLLVTISLICIIVVPVIQGSIRSVFTKRKYYADINTLEDVDKDYKILHAPGMDRKLIFEKGHNKIYDSLNEKMDTTPIGLNELIEKTLENRATGIITPLTDFKSALFDYPQEIAEKFHIVQECPREYLYASICSVHFQWREELTKLTLQLVASGLPGWYHDFTMALLSPRSFVTAPLQTNTPARSLEMKVMGGPFLIFATGVTISITVFVFEVLYGKPSRKFKVNQEEQKFE